MTDYYAVLGIGRLAEPDEVARAYRRSALTLNPACDPAFAAPAVAGSELAAKRVEAQRRFRLLSQAYTVLSDPKVRATYDQFGEDGVRHGGTGPTAKPVDLDAVDADVVFRKFFGVDDPFRVVQEAGGDYAKTYAFYSLDAVRDHNPPPADPLDAEVVVTLEEALQGAKKEVRYTAKHIPAKGAATEEHRTITFAVPLGVRDGQIFEFKSQGNTQEGRTAGPLRLTVRLAKHSVFSREGDNAIVKASVSLCQALTGVSVEVPTLDGRTIVVDVSDIAQPGYRHRVAGEGFPAADGKTRGDLLVELTPVFPEYLSVEQKLELKRIFAESA
jgi:DnaJ family protein B protein 4